jgi:hypothetical protein
VESIDCQSKRRVYTAIPIFEDHLSAASFGSGRSFCIRRHDENACKTFALEERLKNMLVHYARQT